VKSLFYVYRSWNGHSGSISLRPAIFDARRVTFTRSKRREEWVVGKNSPNGGGVVVKVYGMDSNPAGTAFTGRKRYLRSRKREIEEPSSRTSVDRIKQNAPNKK
jgi:hypothetical protein